jgi:ATP-dependent RNA helicase RhlE
VEVERSGTTAARAEQRAYLISQTEKTALLLALLSEERSSTLVFARTKHRTDKVARVIERAGHRVARLHSDRSQSQRRQALEGFKTGRFRVLVATDIAARGIDVAEIGHVVNFDLPHVPEDYVHRIGRTARAAASGKASSLIAPEETGLLRDIERFMRRPVPRAQLPQGFAASTASLGASDTKAHTSTPHRSIHHEARRPNSAPRRHHHGRARGDFRRSAKQGA